jgi:hypothetical protein
MELGEIIKKMGKGFVSLELRPIPPKEAQTGRWSCTYYPKGQWTEPYESYGLEWGETPEEVCMKALEKIEKYKENK